jgi:hypothetical protein
MHSSGWFFAFLLSSRLVLKEIFDFNLVIDVAVFDCRGIALEAAAFALLFCLSYFNYFI